MKERRLLSRREFIGSTSILALSFSAPSFLLRSVAAQGQTLLPAGPDERLLVVLQLAGGNDGLNTVVPFRDDAYYRERPRLALRADQCVSLADGIGFNAEMRALMPWWEKGELSVVQGVGYPNPNRSHFRSTEIWETASDADRNEATGWIGRYLDNNCAGHPGADPAAALAIMNKRPQSFASKSGLGLAVSQPEAFGFLEGYARDNESAFKDVNHVAGARYDRSENASLDFLRQTAMNATLSAEKVRRAASRYKGGVEYPRQQLGQALQTVAKMIAGGLPTRIYYVSHGGFDTHANQQNQHGRLLRELAESVAAFQRDLELQGQAERVVIMTFSEFGRRVRENASGGTDHGAAAPLLIMGKGVRGGLQGRAPSLTDLDEGDLRHAVDFRSVYATMLRDWFAVDARPTLGREFAKLPGLIRA